MSDRKIPKITASRVRYIKLGGGGMWENECFEKGIIRMGFGTVEHFDICRHGQWNDLARRYEDEGKQKGKATENSNQVKVFFEDDGSILWITFSRRLLWWAFSDGTAAVEPHPDGGGTFRQVCGQWKFSDLLGKPLRMDGLSGGLTQLQGYRGTSCDVGETDYVLRRINGVRLPVVEEAEALSKRLQDKIIEMLRKLTPKDFELLVSLVFSGSGWRRLGVVGKTEKTVDMELILPSTGEYAFVQVKSKASQTEFDEEYVEAFEGMSQFGRMFYVYHTGEISCDKQGVTVIGPTRFSEMVLDAGLTSWLIGRVS
jgi:hypothetical protein